MLENQLFLAPSAGFEPALMAPEATALSPELRGRGSECIAFRRTLHTGAYLRSIQKSLRVRRVSAVQSSLSCCLYRYKMPILTYRERTRDHRSLGGSLDGLAKRVTN